MMEIFNHHLPNVVIHVAAQAGVRHLTNNPTAYLEINIIGTCELLYSARAYSLQHMLVASTSSVCGSTTDIPCKETDEVNRQMSFCAATNNSTNIFKNGT